MTGALLKGRVSRRAASRPLMATPSECHWRVYDAAVAVAFNVQALSARLSHGAHWHPRPSRWNDRREPRDPADDHGMMTRMRLIIVMIALAAADSESLRLPLRLQVADAADASPCGQPMRNHWQTRRRA